ncbi:PH domain-containing protein [Streptomyces purpureus]|uniref:PH domain-containing protein n=1 Tax=Streptomyces purpureus TaxID=1951 RepID=UPI0037B8E72A
MPAAIWRWLRYAPLTFWVIGGVGVAVGTVLRVLDGAGVEWWKAGPVRAGFEEFGQSVLWVTVPALLIAVLTAGSLGALALYVENWWGLRTEWSDDRTLTVRRGLLTTRSVGIERDRLRGVMLREPLLLRAGGGATVQAVAGGLGDAEEAQRRGSLLPPAPRATALRVAAGALRRSDTSPFRQPSLTTHPRAALHQRVRRGLYLAVLPPVVTLLALGVLLTPVLLHCAWMYAAVATVTVWLLARDAHRSLGHGLSGPYLLTRSGTFSRDTLALWRDTIAAWTLTTSPYGRRHGLVTLTAAVAAGRHGYRIPGLDAGEAPAFAAAASPGILDEWLVR